MTDLPAPTPSGSGDAPAAGAPPAASPADILYPQGEAEASAAGVSAEEGDAPSGEAAGSDSTPAPAGEETTGGDSGTDALAASYELSLPEGFEADDALMASARSAFAEAGVPADKAQSLMDLYANTVRANAQKELDSFNSTQTEWANEINALPDFQGPTRAKSEQMIGAFLDEYGPEAKAGILSDPRVGNNPALVKLILSAAKVLAEGSATPVGRPAPNDGNGRPTKGRSVADILYPNSAQG
jgi:hypothetical protein